MRLAVRPALAVFAALALLMAALNVHFRDTEHLVGVGLSAWFFASPVMYNLAFVERMTPDLPWLMDLYLLNPLAVIVTAYRAAILPDVALPAGHPTMLVAVALCPLLLLGAYLLFQRLQRSCADLL